MESNVVVPRRIILICSHSQWQPEAHERYINISAYDDVEIYIYINIIVVVVVIIIVIIIIIVVVGIITAASIYKAPFCHMGS